MNKTLVLTGISAFSKVASLVLVTKVLAVYLGSAGFGLASQFWGLSLLLFVMIGGGCEQRIIKYVAEHSDNPADFCGLVSSTLLLSLSFSFIIMTVGVIYREPIAFYMLSDTRYAGCVAWLSVSLLFGAVHFVLLSVLKGLKRETLVTKINLNISLLTLCSFMTLTVYFGLQGALYATILSQVVMFVVSVLFVWREDWFAYLFSGHFCLEHVSDITKHSLTVMAQLMVIPLAQIIVRGDISYLFNWQAVGYWEGAVRLSDIILMTASLVVTRYYLPRLANLRKMSAVRREMRNLFAMLLPVAIIACLVLYMLRDVVVLKLYSAEFLPVTKLLLYQLVGDCFRLSGLLFSAVFLVKGHLKLYSAYEVVFGAIFIVLSHFLALRYGLVGVSYAFAISYGAYFVCVMLSAIKLTRHSGGYVFIPA